MKPFNSEQAKAGAKVITRDGRPVRIVCYDAEGYQSIVALIPRKGFGEVVAQYCSDGSCFVNGEQSKNDLMMASTKREGWVNLFRSSSCDTPRVGSVVYDCEADALGEAADDATVFGTPVIATIRIEWEE